MKNKYLIKVLFILLALGMVCSSHCHEYISESDRITIKSKGLNGDVESSLKIADFYTFSEYDFEKKMFWLKVSIKNGSIFSMLNYSFAATQKDAEKYKEIEMYLRLTSSMGVLVAKNYMVNYCDNVKTCSYSKFYDLIDLTVQDPEEYSWKLMCYISEKTYDLSREERTLILAIHHRNNLYDISSSCERNIFSTESKEFTNINNKLFKSMLAWFTYLDSNQNATSKQQEVFLVNQIKNKN